MSKWKICCVLIILGLTGCTPQTITRTVLEPQLVYPELPPVPPVPKPEFYPVKFLLPEDSSGTILAVSNCINQAPSISTAKVNCSSDSTNVFVGLDQTNYVNLMLDLQEIRSYSTESTQRINEVNIERAEWEMQNKGTSNATH